MKSFFSLSLICGLLVIAGCTNPGLSENLPKTETQTQQEKTIKKAISEFYYCTESLADCSKNNRDTVRTPGFPPATQSGFNNFGSGEELVLDGGIPTMYADESPINFASTQHNAGEDIIYEGNYTLTAELHLPFESIEVLWYGSEQSGFINEFDAGNPDFFYTIDSSLGNINPGTNYYLIRAYLSPNYIFERLFTLHYMTSEQEDIVFQQEPIAGLPSFATSTCPLDFGSYRIVDNNRYDIAFSPYTYARQIVQLPNNIQLFYKFKPSGYQITMFNDTGEASNTLAYRLSCENGVIPQVDMTNTDYIIITQTSDPDSMNDTLIYNPVQNELLSINEDFLKPHLGEDVFYPVYEFEIKENQLIITEKPYCCDNLSNPNGFEEFVFDLTTKELLSSYNFLITEH